MMTDEELWDALDGLFAYDMGCRSSGIKDDKLRDRVKAELEKDKLRLSRIVRDRMLTENRLAQGYGLEDVKEFIDWSDRL
jgi:hypothetical protein